MRRHLRWIASRRRPPRQVLAPRRLQSPPSRDVSGPAVIDARFYEIKGPATAAELAAAVGLSVSRGDPNRSVSSLASAAMAGPDDLTFLEVGADGVQETLSAGICFVPPQYGRTAFMVGDADRNVFAA